MGSIAVHVLHVRKVPQAMTDVTYGSGACRGSHVIVNFPDGDGGKGVIEQRGQQHERGGIICSCPFIRYMPTL